MINNVYIAIIARMGSERLVDKHAINVDGKPMIGYLINRVQLYFKNKISKGQLKIAILTGSESKNKMLGEIANQFGVDIYYGDDFNIPVRMIDFLDSKKSDFIISIDGDDILCSPEGVDEILNQFQANKQYIKTKGLPFGMNSMGMTASFLEKSINRNKRKKLETGWGWIFNEKDCCYVHFNIYNDKKLRFTLDYEQDLKFFTKIIQSGVDFELISTKDVVKLVIDKKYYLENQEVNNQYWANFIKNQKLEIKE